MTDTIEGSDPAQPDHVLLCRIKGADDGQLREFIETSGAESACRPVARRTDAGYETIVVLTADQARMARDTRSGQQVAIEVLEDLTEQASERRSEVGPGNRFDARGAVPRGLGRKE